MIPTSDTLISYIADLFQIGNKKPSLFVKDGNGREYPVLNASIDRRWDTPADEISFTIANTDGNFTPRPYSHVWPNGKVTVSIGYGNERILMFTGIIDKVSAGANNWTIEVSGRSVYKLFLVRDTGPQGAKWENMTIDEIFRDICSRLGLEYIGIGDDPATMAHAYENGKQNDPNVNWYPHPAGWPEPNAYWIWSRPSQGLDFPQEDITLVREIEITQEGDYTVYTTCDDWVKLYLDNNVIITLMDNVVGWQQTYSKVVHLTPGTHKFMALCSNDHYHEDFDYTSPAGFIFCMKDPSGNTVLVSDRTWLVARNFHIRSYELGPFEHWDKAREDLIDPGDYRLYATRDGKIKLEAVKHYTQSDPAVYQFHENINIIQLSMEISDTDAYSDVYVTDGKNTTRFVNNYIKNELLQGEIRSKLEKVEWATTPVTQRAVADSMFGEMIRKSRTLSAGIPGNPALDLGDLVSVYNSQLNITSKYVVKGIRTEIGDSGYVDIVDLEYVR